MLRQRETVSIRLDLIELGHRRQTPSDSEIEHTAKSIEQDGLLVPIGVTCIGDNRYRLVHGATRLSAVKKLGWLEIPATILEGTPGETASAEIVENLTRRHLNKHQCDELTRAYVELRSKERQDGSNGSAEELNDTMSRNSSRTASGHPHRKVAGAKRGRPPTASGQSKKEAAELVGTSVRNVQRATSKKPKQATELAKSRSTVAPKDDAVSKFTDIVLELIRRTAKQKADRFAKTAVPADDLARLGKFLNELAELKKSAAGQTNVFASRGNDVDPDASKEARSNYYAARDELPEQGAVS